MYASHFGATKFAVLLFFVLLCEIFVTYYFPRIKETRYVIHSSLFLMSENVAKTLSSMRENIVLGFYNNIYLINKVKILETQVAQLNGINISLDKKISYLEGLFNNYSEYFDYIYAMGYPVVDSSVSSHIMFKKGSLSGIYDKAFVFDNKGLVGWIIELQEESSKAVVLDDSSTIMPVRIGEKNRALMYTSPFFDPVIKGIDETITSDIYEGDPVYPFNVMGIFDKDDVIVGYTYKDRIGSWRVKMPERGSTGMYFISVRKLNE